MMTAKCFKTMDLSGETHLNYLPDFGPQCFPHIYRTNGKNLMDLPKQKSNWCKGPMHFAVSEVKLIIGVPG